jgi:hypothetical protein
LMAQMRGASELATACFSGAARLAFGQGSSAKVDAG